MLATTRRRTNKPSLSERYFDKRSLINNIVAVCSVLGIEKKEGDILKRTFLPTIVYGIIAVIAGLLL
jgi:hypothetical protein